MGKSQGLHPDRALSAVKVRQVSKPGRYADGNGLYLVVDPSGAKRWVQRLVVRGRRRDIGLGSSRLVSLSEAREQALEYRKLARSGGDPLEQREKSRNDAPTFAEAAKTVHELLLPTWRNPKAAAQWLSTLETYVFPQIGARGVDEIETAAILQVLTPIWSSRPETARRIRQRLAKVFDWAKASGHRAAENPVVGVKLALPQQAIKQKHHKSLPFAEMRTFMGDLRRDERCSPMSKLGLEFLILTAGRTSEFRFACWREVDLQSRVWTVPSERMKTGKAHRVVLSSQAIRILEQAKALSPDSELIFPNLNSRRPLSENAFLSVLKALDVDGTTHGFRSSFRDWSAELTEHANEVAEMALSHTIRSRVEASYRRGDLLERRRALMQDWADYIDPVIGLSQGRVQR